jgi:hypothetical protein
VDRGYVSKEDLYDVMFRVHRFLYSKLYLCHRHMVKRFGSQLLQNADN